MANDEPKRGASKAREGSAEQPTTPTSNLTANILGEERSFFPFALVVGGALFMLCAVPAAAYAGMQGSIWSGVLAVVLLVAGYLMRRKGKLG